MGVSALQAALLGGSSQGVVSWCGVMGGSAGKVLYWEVLLTRRAWRCQVALFPPHGMVHPCLQEERRVVFIGKIPSRMTRSELRHRFSVFGDIEECTLHFRSEG